MKFQFLLLILVLMTRPSDSIRIWELSLHDGARVEIISTLRHLNVSVIVADHKGNRGPFGSIHHNDPGVLYTNSFPEQFSFADRVHELSEEDLNAFYEFYKQDKLFQTADAVLCTSPVSLCEAFLPLNKSLIWMPGSSRYNLGRQCNLDAWNNLNRHIEQGVTQSALSSRPLHVVAAMNSFDAAYINYYTGIFPRIIEPSGLLYGARLAEYNTLQAPRSEILLGPSQGVFLSTKHMSQLKSISKANNLSFVHPTTMYGRYKLPQLAAHRAIVIIPIAIQSHFFAEVYAMGLPLLLPSLEFLMDLDTIEDRRPTTSCQPPVHLGSPPALVSKTASVLRPLRHAASEHKLDPESDDPEAVRYWLSLTPYYQWPHIIYFSSWQDLVDKIRSSNWKEIHHSMNIENSRRFESSRNKFSEILEQLTRKGHFDTPKGSYKEAALATLGVTKIMVE